MKVWLDFCEPKSVTMLRPLYETLSNQKHDPFITARDFDSTFYLLNKWGIDYISAGKYGGHTLLGKVKAYSSRISKLINIIEKKKPEFLFCITSPEAMRISFGLQIPNIMFNDEPRSYGPCTTTFPYVDQLIVPKCIPIEWYLDYGLKEAKIIRFNGIDEVGWLNPKIFKPDKLVLKNLNLVENNYVVCRTEPTKAGYLIDKMKPHETLLTEIIPDLLNNTELKYLILTRNNEQFSYLNKLFQSEIRDDKLRVYKGLNKLSHIIYFSKLVISGGGTMVRESALLGVPSIEFFPLETYPQETFLMENGFPLKHLKTTKQIISSVYDFIESRRKKTDEMILALDNPIEIAINEFKNRLRIN